ncbi:MAG: sodium/proline symporter PutP [Gammaproteobacteria bacterium]|nr:sodium/proline symporter PutP [Gammaproteobacteria bacterium]
MNPDRISIITTFAVYIVIMLLVGVTAYRATRSLSDYILGGRRLNSWVAALSAQASDMSGWLLLGLPGFAYASGLESIWLAGGLLAGIYLNWRLVAFRLRRYTQALDNALTLPDFFERRFRDDSRMLRVISAFFILFFFMFYTSAGLVAGGKLFNAVFDLPHMWAVMAGAAVVVIYTFIGGFLAVSWTDVIQGMMMLVALVAVPAVAVFELGGLTEAVVAVERINPRLLDPWTAAEGGVLSVVALVSLLGWGLGYFGQPHILARFMAIRSPEDIPAARAIAVGWSLVAMVGAILVGLVGIGLLAEPLDGTDREKVFIFLVEMLFHPVLAGVWLAAILAAIMSTADSQLLVSSSALAEDFYKGMYRPEAEDRELMWVGRVAVIGIALLALWFASDPDSQVLELVAYAWAGFGAAFGPVILLSLFWARMNRDGALAGILVGAVTVIIWKQLSGSIFDLYEMVPGVLLSVVATVVISLVTASPEEGIGARHTLIVRPDL